LIDPFILLAMDEARGAGRGLSVKARQVVGSVVSV